MRYPLVALLLAQAAPAHAQTEASQGLKRSGLYGWGLGLELPMVGLTTGAAEHSRVGWGYALGAAVSYEFTPHWLGRLMVSGGATSGARARVRYLENVAAGERTYTHQAADWLSVETGLGVAYLFRNSERPWAPYVGGDVLFNFAGYNFHFDKSLANLEERDQGDVLARCTGDVCESTIHDGLGFGWAAGIRGGVRLELASWLSTQSELALVYTRTGREQISNTVDNREVETAREDVWLMRWTFSVRLGL
ncbi:MAG: hypothetical protein HYZ27_01720 [Deltaproteobacteria bacterium]|nr:hypothetical protein [Deltaproteobacteria bacterium]